MDRTSYRQVKNYISNDLKISRQEIIEIIRQEIKVFTERALRNTYGSNDIGSIIREEVKRQLALKSYSVASEIERAVAIRARSIIENELKINITIDNKQNEKSDTF